MMSGVQTELPFLRYCKYLRIPSIQRLLTGDKYLLEYGTRAISNAKGQEGHTSNVFSTILAESEKDGTALSHQDVNLEAGNFIVAGSDTTAVTLTYLIWAVLKQPKLQRDLENEVQSLSPDFTDADLETLPLLNAVIEETLRLYGAAPASLPRTTPAGGATLNGYLIPAGTIVSTQAYTIHRDSTLFPNPDMYGLSHSHFHLSANKTKGSIPHAFLNERSFPLMRRRRFMHSVLVREFVLASIWLVWSSGLRLVCSFVSVLVRGWRRVVRMRVWKWRIISLLLLGLIVVR